MTYDDKRKASLNALEGYGASTFIPPFTEIAYRKFLEKTNDMDLDNTVYLINQLEILRRQSNDFNNDMNAFFKSFPTNDMNTTMRALIILKLAMNIEDQNYEYRGTTSFFTQDIDNFRQKIEAQEAILEKQAAEKKAAGEFKSFDIDIMEYDYAKHKVEQQAKSLSRPSHMTREDQAKEFFSVPHSQAETDAFLDKFNRESPKRIYSITNSDESMAEYNFLKGKGMYLQNFPLNDPDMRNVLLEAGVIGKDRDKKDGGIMREANEKFGVRKLNGIGISSYYKLAYSVPAIKDFDLENNRITLMFAREAPIGLKSSHVSIEMPLSKVDDLVKAESKQNAQHVATFKKNPETEDIDGMTRKLAIAIRSAQIHSKTVLQKVLKKAP